MIKSIFAYSASCSIIGSLLVKQLGIVKLSGQK